MEEPNPELTHNKHGPRPFQIQLMDLMLWVILTGLLFGLLNQGYKEDVYVIAPWARGFLLGLAAFSAGVFVYFATRYMVGPNPLTSWRTQVYFLSVVLLAGYFGFLISIAALAVGVQELATKHRFAPFLVAFVLVPLFAVAVTLTSKWLDRYQSKG